MSERAQKSRQHDMRIRIVYFTLNTIYLGLFSALMKNATPYKRHILVIGDMF